MILPDAVQHGKKKRQRSQYHWCPFYWSPSCLFGRGNTIWPVISRGESARANAGYSFRDFPVVAHKQRAGFEKAAYPRIREKHWLYYPLKFDLNCTYHKHKSFMRTAVVPYTRQSACSLTGSLVEFLLDLKWHRRVWAASLCCSCKSSLAHSIWVSTDTRSISSSFPFLSFNIFVQRLYFYWDICRSSSSVYKWAKMKSSSPGVLGDKPSQQVKSHWQTCSALSWICLTFKWCCGSRRPKAAGTWSSTRGRKLNTLSCIMHM